MKDFVSRLQETGDIPFSLFAQQDSVEFLLPFLDYVQREIQGITSFCNVEIQTTIE
jgi:uncharacterized UBP type Zn finger protein